MTRLPAACAAETRKLLARETLLYMTVLPLAALLLFGLLYFRRLGRDYPVDVLDLDASFASRLAISYIDASAELEVRAVQRDEAEALAALRRGETAAVVRLPRGLLRDVKRRHPVQADVWVDGRNLVAANSVLTGLQKALGTGMAGARLIILRKLMPAGPAREELLPARILYRPLGNPSLDYSLFLLTALLLLLVQQCVLVGSAVALAGESERGSLAASVYAAGGPLAFSAARLLAVMLLQAPTLAGLLLLYAGPLSLPLRRPALNALLMLLFASATAALAHLLGPLFRRRQAALQALAFYSLPAFFLSGYTWPAENMPAPLRALAALLPSTPALNAFPRLNTLGADAAALLPWLAHLGALLLAYGLAGAGVIAWRVRREEREAKGLPPATA